jgi:signal transduction histidine kinase
MAEINDNQSKEFSKPTETSVQMNNTVMKIWESRVRERVKSAPSKSGLILRDIFPELLDKLLTAVSRGHSMGNFEMVSAIGTDLGFQRAGLNDYTISQVLLEYKILRQVIFEVIDDKKLRSKEVINDILDILDEGIQKAIEEFSRVRNEDLNRSNRDLQHFAAIAAHDLKSPLATITGFAELLSDDLQGKIELEDLEYIQTIKRSAARMTLLIDRLLKYSSVGQEPVSFEPVLTDQVVIDALDNLKPTIESTHAKVHTANLPVVYGDKSLLGQVFQNLIGNALKYRNLKTQTEIWIGATAQGDSWLFSIEDNGIGFDPMDKEDIFNLFKRLDSATHEGVGIGLATVRKVIELHGGKIWAESQPGIGSKFFFNLPKSKAQHVFR